MGLSRHLPVPVKGSSTGTTMIGIQDAGGLQVEVVMAEFDRSQRASQAAVSSRKPAHSHAG
jgi:hypothetical protein